DINSFFFTSSHDRFQPRISPLSMNNDSARRRTVSCMPRIAAFVASILVMGSPLMASDDDPPVPQPRTDEWRQARRQKVQGPEESQRSGLEKILLEVKERRILERFEAGFAGFHPKIGGLTTGSGFALGTEYRHEGLAHGRLDFRFSTQASLTHYLRNEIGVSVPKLWKDRLFLAFDAANRNYPQEDFYGLGTDSKVE